MNKKNEMATRITKSLITLLMAFIACGASATDFTNREASSDAKRLSATPLDTFKIKTVTLGNRMTMNLDSVILEPSMLYLPLIFEKYEAFDDSITVPAYNRVKAAALNADDEWLRDAQATTRSVRMARYHTMVNTPQYTYYNLDILPEPPKQYAITADPSSRKLELEAKDLSHDLGLSDDEYDVVKVRNWLHSFNGSIHFSQAYMSGNWYQGGNNNLNVIGNFSWNVTLNPNKYKNLLFDNTLQYKIGLASAPQDTLRGYSISEDLLQMNTKFGYKAFKHWYYSVAMLFKTQLLSNYTPNTNNLKASFLTPGELNLGLGMTYNTKSKNGYASFDMSISPVSYNMKICRENTRVNPTSMGVDEGKHFKHKFGSSLEARFSWKITPAISWNSRLYAFTDYDYLQGDWEHTFNFSINKYLSTQLYAHLRYDKSATRDDAWSYWQFKEILSFGFTYVFSMK